MSKLTIYHDQDPTTPRFESEEGVEIQAELSAVGVRFERWRANAPVSADMSQDEVIAAYHHEIERLKGERGYQTVDVVSMYPEHPQRAEFREKFLFEHRHTEDEVRFFVAGSGLFCLHLGDRVYQVLCAQDDLISVPANTPHWFDMGSAPSFSAIRLFNNTEGWVAHATGDELATRFPLLP